MATAVVCSGCSAPQIRSAAHPVETARTPLTVESRQREVVTSAELAGLSGASLYDALLRLRPAMLNRRAPTVAEADGAAPEVYVDERLRGDVRELALLPVQEIREVRYLSAAESAIRFGRRSAGGAIVVSTR